MNEPRHQSLVFNIQNLADERRRFSGLLEKGHLGLERDRFVHEGGDLVFDLTVYFAGTEILVEGRIEVEVQLMCSHCGDFFPYDLVVERFIAAYESAAHPEEVDPLPEIREELLLKLPSYPDCSLHGGRSCPFQEKLAEAAPPEAPPKGDQRWEALDNLSDL